MQVIDVILAVIQLGCNLVLSGTLLYSGICTVSWEESCTRSERPPKRPVLDYNRNLCYAYVLVDTFSVTVIILVYNSVQPYSPPHIACF